MCNLRRDHCVRFSLSVFELICKFPMYGECIRAFGLEKEDVWIEDFFGSKCELGKGSVASSGSYFEGVWN